MQLDPMLKFLKRLLKSSPAKDREFTFFLTTMPAVGDKYEYTVKAASKEQAFELLVRWFYEVGPNAPAQNSIQQEHYDTVHRSLEVFETNMPGWFAHIIHGERVLQIERKMFDLYCKTHNIPTRSRMAEDN